MERLAQTELASGDAPHQFQVYRRDRAGYLMLDDQKIQLAPSVIFGAPPKHWWAVWN